MSFHRAVISSLRVLITRSASSSKCRPTVDTGEAAWEDEALLADDLYPKCFIHAVYECTMGSFDVSGGKEDCMSCLERLDSISANGARRSRRVWWKAVWRDKWLLGAALADRLELEARGAGCEGPGSDRGADTGRGEDGGDEPVASSSRILRTVRICRIKLSWMIAFQEERSSAKASLA